MERDRLTNATTDRLGCHHYTRPSLAITQASTYNIANTNKAPQNGGGNFSSSLGRYKPVIACLPITSCAMLETSFSGSSLHFYRASICEGGLGSRNSVRLSVCPSHAWIVTKLNDALQIFLYHTKGQSLCYSDTNSGWWATPLPSEICAQSDPPPSKNADFDRFPLITSQP